MRAESLTAASLTFRILILGSADARLRIVSERLDFKNNLVASVLVRRGGQPFEPLGSV